MRKIPFRAPTDSSAQGRGGTDLRPVFSDEFLQDYRVDGLIYFTDGYGPFPNSAPGITTLWVLTEHWAFPCPWGSRALLRCP
ncbi:MAG: hypothetical protein KDA72_06445 [Planctomycetales bacterium]|nr:hypothetical protein [Planctomycetales bacterium]